MIQAITFDLWNTIFTNKFYTEIRINWFTQFLKERDIFFSLIDIKNAFNIAFNLPEGYFKKNNHIFTEDRLLIMLNILKLDFSENDKDLIKNKFEAVMLDDPPSLKKGVKRTLEELSLTYKIGLISNTGITPGRIIIKVFEEYNILQYFQVMIFSDEIGYYKPHTLLFNTALKELECDPRYAIHIGDRLDTDIKGAKECKMYTIWVNDSFPQNLKDIKPDYEIQEISEAIPIIKNLR
ncbi:MAG: HAD family hydrolase [Candidatus Hodarchaeota archaeon]